METHGPNDVRIGWVGLGIMGAELVGRLIGKGHSVVGWNRSKHKAASLQAEGMVLAASPQAVAEAADVIFVMVTDSAALESVFAGPDGILSGLSPGKVVVDCSTVSPALSGRNAEQARARGADLVDAPISGSHISVQQGKAVTFVGGRQETFERIRPILLDIGPNSTHVGDNGQALRLKIAVNLQLAVQMLAFCEGVLLAEKSGIARAVAVEVMTTCAISSPMLQYRGPLVLPANDSNAAWFDFNMMQKDMRLAIELGKELGVPLPTTAITNQFLTAGRGMGLGHKDFAHVFQVLARMSGVEYEQPKARL